MKKTGTPLHMTILWVLCLTAFPLTVWPLVYAATTVGLAPEIHVIFRDADWRMALGYFLPCIAFAWLGEGASLLRSFLVLRNEAGKRLQIILANLVLVLPYLAAVAWAVFHFRMELATPMALGAAVFCIFYASRHAGELYDELLPRTLLTIGLGTGAFAMVVCWGLKVGYSMNALIWPFVIEAVICAIAQNQGNIDYMMQRRKHDLSHLPRRVRWYSLYVTGSVVLLILLVTIFRPQLAWLLGKLLTGAKTVIFGILSFIFWLFRSDSTEETVEPEPEGMGGGGMGLPQGGEGSPWWDYILGTAMVLLVLWLIWTYRKNILDALRQLRDRFVGFIRRHLLNTTAVQKLSSVIGGQSEYYSDQTETLPPEEEREEKTFRLRDWKRQVRRLASSPDSPEKYREGYRLGLSWLRFRGMEIRPSDTPAEIAGKLQLLPRESWDTVTRFYELTRYDEQVPGPDAQRKLSEVLKEMAKG